MGGSGISFTTKVRADRWRSPAAWARALRILLLVGLTVAGYRPGLSPIWISLVVPVSSEATEPMESESPGDSRDSAAEEEFFYHGQRSERSLRGDLARGKLPLNHLNTHFSHGRGFLMGNISFRSEHALRNGTGAHLRC